MNQDALSYAKSRYFKMAVKSHVTSYDRFDIDFDVGEADIFGKGA